MRKSYLLGLWFICLVLASCNKEEPLAQAEATDSGNVETKGSAKPYEVIDGVLHIRSLEDLSELTTSLEGMSEDELFEWEKTHDFYSLFHAVVDAEEDIFSDSLSFESKLRKYDDIVYLDEDGMIQAKVLAHFYRLICNKEGYFYIGECKYKVVGDEIMVVNTKTRSIDKRSYVVGSSVQTKAETHSPRLPLASSSYKGNKRLIQLNVTYIRVIAKNAQGDWVAQQKLQVESRSGKKVMGKYKRYKTLHLMDALAFYCAKGVYTESPGVYSTRVVRYEILNVAGSVGEQKYFVMHFGLSPFNKWYPESAISIKDTDIWFVQVRIKTRGSGDSGAK